ncbi:SdpI/YhfL family protein [Mucilaginibacter yixingensis]|uniref:SdpI/YhfL family protein n=1 Tax=Mucilaginibacter yixingensis TaxID=1295612 RepID=A0A2T5JDW9_9SPHI|nr:SdpI family protein [Mucilaginibacter yixingensis]PTQ99970.1 SdpI/YhfL family protein [Mucilaginibacter yixingensis]
MHLKEFIYGPQLVGVILIIAGLILKKYPPKKINGLYGYRTYRSKSSQRNWDEGNRYSAILMVRIAWILLIGGLIGTVALHFVHNRALKEGLTFLLMTGGTMTGMIIMIVKTERHLAKFEEDEE